MNTIPRCYILISIAEHLRRQTNDLECVSDMVQTLDEMFDKSCSNVRKATIGALRNTRMIGGSVRDHCLKMMGRINTTEVMWAKLEQETKVDMILESLPDNFNQFKVNYNMNKLKLTPVDLIHELESAKSSLLKQGSAYHAESSSKPKGKPNGGKRNKKQKETGPASKLVAMKKPKGKCFKCRQKGH